MLGDFVHETTGGVMLERRVQRLTSCVCLSAENAVTPQSERRRSLPPSEEQHLRVESSAFFSYHLRYQQRDSLTERSFRAESVATVQCTQTG
jgi:hypothetical protein